MGGRDSCQPTSWLPLPINTHSVQSAHTRITYLMHIRPYCTYCKRHTQLWLCFREGFSFISNQTSPTYFLWFQSHPLFELCFWFYNLLWITYLLWNDGCVLKCVAVHLPQHAVVIHMDASALSHATERFCCCSNWLCSMIADRSKMSYTNIHGLMLISWTSVQSCSLYFFHPYSRNKILGETLCWVW